MADNKVPASKESLKTMGTWKKKKFSKRTKSSQTTGKQKGIVTTALERYMCRRNRSYKHPLYGRVMAHLTGEKRISQKGKK